MPRSLAADLSPDLSPVSGPPHTCLVLGSIALGLSRVSARPEAPHRRAERSPPVERKIRPRVSRPRSSSQNRVGSSNPIAFPFKFLNQLVNIYKKSPAGILITNALNLQID